jgi:hypothetical protein
MLDHFVPENIMDSLNLMYLISVLHVMNRGGETNTIDTSVIKHIAIRHVSLFPRSPSTKWAKMFGGVWEKRFSLISKRGF